MKRKKGFTLVELLMAVFVLAVGIMGILLLYTNSMLSSEFAWDMTTATSHAEYILEEMQARESLNDIRSTNWGMWAQKQGLNTIPHETIAVDFPHVSGNPLDILVTVSWKRKLRTNHITLKTKMTK
jgi:prepilin-type N-terminal cleavage/methylation domain-containing protein